MECKNCEKTLTPEEEVCCVTCVDAVKCPVNNHVLAYCAGFLKSRAVDQVTSALELFFSEDDLQIARKTVRDFNSDALKDLDIMQIQNRRGTNQRSAAKIIAQDITTAVDALMKVENNKYQFITDDICKLPVLRPSEGPADNDERLLTIEKKLKRIETQLLHYDGALVENTLHQKTHETVIKDLEVKLANAARDIQSHEMMVKQVRPTYAQKLGAQKNAVASAEPLPKRTMQADTSLAGRLISLFTQNEPSKPQEVENTVNVGSDDGWQVMQKKKGRRQPRSLQGNADSTTVKGVPEQAPDRDLWISNIDMTIDDVMKDFTAKGGSKADAPMEVRKLEKRYKDDFRWKCFRLTISKMDYSRVYDSEFWPKNIRFRKYWVTENERKGGQKEGTKEAESQ